MEALVPSMVLRFRRVTVKEVAREMGGLYRNVVMVLSIAMD
ncbi:MAG: hypothetical protein ACP5Q4_08850 [Candidatus Caldatribacteriaceae bacterium]